MADTINNGIPLVPENTIDPAAGLNLALLVIDRLLQLKVLDMKINTPPASPAAGSRYIVGTAPTGAWVGKNLQVAEWMPDGYWQFSPASVTVFGTSIWLNTGTDWVPASAGGGAAWGGITGTLADQADLAAALSDKANAGDLGTAAYFDSISDNFSVMPYQLLRVGAAGMLSTTYLSTDIYSDALEKGSHILRANSSTAGALDQNLTCLSMKPVDNYSAFIAINHTNGRTYSGYINNSAPPVWNELYSSSTLGSGIAGLPTGAAGSHAMLRNAGASTVTAGASVAGSSLRYAGTGSASGATPSGTWRCEGHADVGDATLFVRTV